MSTEIIPTRKSLLLRLKDWDDQKSWREFFELYWRLIYGVAIKAGLTEVEAQEVLQETVISFAKEIKTFQYDRSKGRFKSWLLQITRRRIVDEFRKRRPADANSEATADAKQEGTCETDIIERIPDPSGSALDTIWEEEWQKNLVETALEKIRSRINPKHYEIFDRHALKNEPVREIARGAGVSVAQVYWVKHRISGMLKREIKALEAKLV
jgi:RNA polymerase sigma-70 factor (ECF subfamily)